MRVLHCQKFIPPIAEPDLDTFCQSHFFFSEEAAGCPAYGIDTPVEFGSLIS